MHACPNCRCTSPKQTTTSTNRPMSPIIIRPISPNNPFTKKNLYYNRTDQLHNSNTSLSPSSYNGSNNNYRKQYMRSPSPSSPLLSTSPSIKVNIRYSSPTRQNNSIRRQQSKQIKRQRISPAKNILYTFSRFNSQHHNNYNNNQEEELQQPRKPNILNRNKKQKQYNNNINYNINNNNYTEKNNTTFNSTSSPPTQAQYRMYNVFDDNKIAETIIKQLKLNYDYFGVDDISDISADVSL